MTAIRNMSLSPSPPKKPVFLKMGQFAVWVIVAIQFLDFFNSAALMSPSPYPEGGAVLILAGTYLAIALQLQAGYAKSAWAYIALGVTGALLDLLAPIERGGLDTASGLLYSISYLAMPFAMLGLLHPLSRKWLQEMAHLRNCAHTDVRLAQAKYLQKLSLVWLAVPFVGLKAAIHLDADMLVAALFALPVLATGIGMLIVAILRIAHLLKK